MIWSSELKFSSSFVDALQTFPNTAHDFAWIALLRGTSNAITTVSLRPFHFSFFSFRFSLLIGRIHHIESPTQLTSDCPHTQIHKGTWVLCCEGAFGLSPVHLWDTQYTAVHSRGYDTFVFIILGDHFPHPLISVPAKVKKPKSNEITD